MACSTRRRVGAEIDRLPDRTYDTVDVDTPAARATSSIVAISELLTTGPATFSSRCG
jgi:hypothetical protein